MPNRTENFRVQIINLYLYYGGDNMVGIYKITNKINNKCYIGQSRDIDRRWRAHRAASLDYPLYRAFKKYGINNFLFEVLEECPISDLNERELYWISQFDSCREGYNQTASYQPVARYVKLTDDLLDQLTIDLLETDIIYDELSEKYGLGKDYISEINHGKSWYRENLSYPLRQYKKFTFCIDCGKEITHGSNRCISCQSLYQRKTIWPNRDTLKQKIRKQSFISIGQEYGVSDNSIKKWCKSYDLPHLKREIKKYSDSEWELL